MPALGPAPVEARPQAVTNVRLELPIDTTALMRRIEAAFPETPVAIVNWVPNAACDFRGRSRECESAKVEGTIQRDGPIGQRVSGGRLWLVIAYRYDFKARGLNHASHLTEAKAGTLEATIPLEVELAANHSLQMRLRDEIALSEREIVVLKGKLSLAQQLEPRLKKQAAAISTDLGQQGSAPLTRALVQQAWRALHGPIRIATAPDVYLRLEPTGLAGAGLVAAADGLQLRIAVSARTALYQGERPAPMLLRPLPEPSRAVPVEPTRITVPGLVSLAPMQRALEAAFPKQQEIATRADPTAPVVKVRVEKLDLFASRDLLALELKLDVLEPRPWYGLGGSLYLVGKPVLADNGRSIGLQDVSFPELRREPARKGAGRSLPVTATPPPPARTDTGGVRLGLEPFAGRFASVGRLEIDPADMSAVLAKVNAQIGQALEGDLALAGAFDTIAIAAVEPARDHLKVSYDLTGSLNIRLDPATIVTRSASSLEPTQWSEKPVPAGRPAAAAGAGARKK